MKNNKTNELQKWHDKYYNAVVTDKNKDDLDNLLEVERELSLRENQ